MMVHVKCMLDLSSEGVCNYHDTSPREMPTGSTARDLAGRLALDDAKIKLVFVNHKEVALDTELHDGDRIAYSPY